jgi:hypothetical protein
VTGTKLPQLKRLEIGVFLRNLEPVTDFRGIRSSFATDTSLVRVRKLRRRTSIRKFVVASFYRLYTGG